MTNHATPDPMGAFARRAEAERIVNEVLDARAAGAEMAARETLHTASQRNPETLEVMREVEESLHELGKPPRGRDLTRAILTRVNEQRAFLPRRARRRVSATRLAVACGALATLSLVALLQRLGGPESPFAHGSDALSGIGDVPGAIAEPPTIFADAAPARDRRAIRAPLTFGNSADYESRWNWASGAPERTERPFTVVFVPPSSLASASAQPSPFLVSDRAGFAPHPGLLTNTPSAASMHFTRDQAAEDARRRLDAEEHPLRLSPELAKPGH